MCLWYRRILNEYGEPRPVHVSRCGPARKLKLYSWVRWPYKETKQSNQWEWEQIRVLAFSLYQAREKIKDCEFYQEYNPELVKMALESFPLDVDDSDSMPQIYKS